MVGCKHRHTEKIIEEMKKGVSGFMRVKNDAEFVEACIDSCIDALDELVIVYNDCSDATPELVEKKRQEYPDKIKVYEYKHKVYSVNLSIEEYEYAQSLSDDSPHLLCNFYNFALSKVSYDCAVKIDSDQIYIAEQLKKWCDFYRRDEVLCKSMKYYWGWIFNLYFIAYKFICFKTGKVHNLLPERLVSFMYPYYEEYMRYEAGRGRVCLSLSGLNVFKDNGWFVCLGRKGNGLNILPPFNGEGDHLIFRVSKKTYFRRFDMPYYNLLANSEYSLIEEFVHPYKVLCAGFAWFHLNAYRIKYRDEVRQVKAAFPKAFYKIKDFLNLDYYSILKLIDKNMYSLRQNILFSFVYKSDNSALKCNVGLLDNFKL